MERVRTYMDQPADQTARKVAWIDARETCPPDSAPRALRPWASRVYTCPLSALAGGGGAKDKPNPWRGQCRNGCPRRTAGPRRVAIPPIVCEWPFAVAPA